jgi:hypothetical protein
MSWEIWAVLGVAVVVAVLGCWFFGPLEMHRPVGGYQPTQDRDIPPPAPPKSEQCGQAAMPQAVFRLADKGQTPIALAHVAALGTIYCEKRKDQAAPVFILGVYISGGFVAPLVYATQEAAEQDGKMLMESVNKWWRMQANPVIHLSS